MRLLAVAFASRQDFLRHYSATYPGGALFVPTRAGFDPGEQIVVEVDLPELPTRVRVRASVVSADGERGGWVALSPLDSQRVEYLLSVARCEREPFDLERQHDRLPTGLEVSCSIDELGENHPQIRCQAGDLGAGGVFLIADIAPAVGTRVRLRIPMGDTREIRIGGRVVWAHEEGFGVRFDPTDRNGRRSVRKLLRKATETGDLAFAS